MNTPEKVISGVLSSFILGMPPAQAESAAIARYQVTFERTWSSETHPEDFPLLAHFSPVIGLTHNAGYSPLHAGATATPGVEMLCEEGKHAPLDAEIRAAVNDGAAGSLIETSDPIRDVPGQATVVFETDSDHPRVSIAAMIAPSPDWCAVAADVELFEGGQWIAEKTVDLYAWDAGTDAGGSYRAFDSDMQPRGQIQLSDAAYFAKDGKPIPVGKVHFVRQ